MSGIVTRIIAPIVFGVGACWVLVPKPKEADPETLSDEEKLLRASVRAKGPVDLTALREETNRKRKEMAEEYGRQLKLQEEARQKRIAEGLEEPDDPNKPKKRIAYAKVPYGRDM